MASRAAGERAYHRRMRSFSSALLVLLSSTALLAACGGNVLVNAGGSSTTGTETGTGGDTTTTTTSSTTTTTTTSSTKPPVCIETHESFKATLEEPDGSVIGCYVTGQTLPLELTMQAAVVEAQGSTIVLDTCGPTADCSGPIIHRLVIDSPNFYTYIPAGAFVELRMDLEPAWIGCIHRVTLTNLPSWGGVPNPVPEKRVWLAGSEGYQGSMDGAPFTAEAVPLGCTYPNADCAQHEDYEWLFTTPSSPEGVHVPMGQTMIWSDSSASYQVRNLRSFSSGNCDDYWNWAFWLVYSPPPI